MDEVKRLGRAFADGTLDVTGMRRLQGLLKRRLVGVERVPEPPKFEYPEGLEYETDDMPPVYRGVVTIPRGTGEPHQWVLDMEVATTHDLLDALPVKLVEHRLDRESFQIVITIWRDGCLSTGRMDLNVHRHTDEATHYLAMCLAIENLFQKLSGEAL